MGSEGHCRNILRPTFRNIGVGVSRSGIGRIRHGTWTQDFGLLGGQPASVAELGPGATAARTEPRLADPPTVALAGRSRGVGHRIKRERRVAQVPLGVERRLAA